MQRIFQKSFSRTILNVTLLVGAAATLSACQNTRPMNEGYAGGHAKAMTSQQGHVNMESLLKPVPNTGLSVEQDASFPIIEVMGLAVKNADKLGLTAEQRQTLADYRKVAQPKRIQLQANEKALRGQLRTALMEGEDNLTTDRLMRQISQTEHAHLQIRRECLQLIRSTLNKAQYEQLMSIYRVTLVN